jgi:acylphosphatase
MNPVVWSVNMENIEIHAIATGDIQGVGFRATVTQHAARLGLTGTVRNLPDGSVEIFVQGGRNKITEFFKLIREDSGFAQVHSISAQEIFSRNQYQGFRTIF